MDDSELTGKARGIARCLTYNDDVPQAQAKHMLLEMAHRLDVRNTKVFRRRGDRALCVVNGLGMSRKLTLGERLLWLWFGLVPARVRNGP